MASRPPSVGGGGLVRVLSGNGVMKRRRLSADEFAQVLPNLSVLPRMFAVVLTVNLQLQGIDFIIEMRMSC